MFMLKSTHEAEMREADDKAYQAWSKAITERDNLRIERDGADERFKQAIKDIAGLTEDVAQAEKVADARARKIAELNAEIAALRPDAQKWRDRAHREHLRRTKTRTAPAKKR